MPPTCGPSENVTFGDQSILRQRVNPYTKYIITFGWIAVIVFLLSLYLSYKDILLIITINLMIFLMHRCRVGKD